MMLNLWFAPNGQVLRAASGWANLLPHVEHRAWPLVQGFPARAKNLNEVVR